MSEEDRAKDQAKSQLESIREMLAAVSVDYDRLEELKEELTDAHEAEGNPTPFDGWLKEMVENEDGTLQEAAQELNDLNAAAGDCASEDDARQRIQEDPLSVQVRTGWYTPGTENPEAEEFEILLCTGGPAVRIVGRLDMHGGPDDARLEYQDWGTPWRDYYEPGIGETLLEYARHFWFGE